MPFDFDDEQKGSGGSFVFDDEKPAEKKKRGVVEKARDYGLTILSGAAAGVANTEAALGTLAQAPVEGIRSGVAGAAAALDRGVTNLSNWIEPGSAQVNQALQETAQDQAQQAAAARAANLRGTPGQTVSFSRDIARMGRSMEQDGRERGASLKAFDQENNPELIRQQQELSKANGVIDTAKALVDNPMAFTQSLAQSAPDMALGAGVAGGAARLAGGSAKVASVVGAGAEGASAAMQARESVFQQVQAMPTDKLAEGSERYREILATVGGDAEKARTALANELADQAPVLVGAGTVAGSWLTNKLFKADTSAAILAGKRVGVKDIPKNFVHEGTEEVLQGIPEDLTTHTAISQADPTHQLDLGGSAVQNFAAGGVLGGGGAVGGVVGQKINDLRYGKNSSTPNVEEAKAPVLPENQGGAPVNASEILGTPSTRTETGPVGTNDTTDAEKALRTPVQLTTLDRVEAIDKQIAAEPEGSDKVQALRAERDQLAKDFPVVTPGNPTTFSTETGTKLEGQYALMDADALVTSHDANLRSNPAYPQELQPRQRERAASELQVSGIVQRLDPARLGLSADAATGAPIVGADGLVESGNARSIALKRIYQANGQKAEDYKQFLRENAAQFGITPEAVATMGKPVLVRVRSTPVNRAEFARQANASTVAQMSPSEQAKADAARIDVLDDLNPDESGEFSTSRDFIRRFVARLPVTEQASMLDASGALSSTGYARVRNAVLAKAYGDSPVLARMTESMDDNLRNISKALMAAAPKVAQMRQAIAQGNRFDADITPDLVAAVEELSRLKDAGTSVQDALAQAGMFGEQYSDETKQLLQFLADNIRRPRRMADFIVAYMDALESAGDPNQGSLLGEVEPPAKGDLLNAAKKGTEDNGSTQDTAKDVGKDTQRGEPGEGSQAGEQGAGQPQDAQSSRSSDEGAGSAGSGTDQETRLSRSGSVAKSEWVAFPKDSGTIGIPRAEMPQIKGEHRGALVQFLQARGIDHRTEEVQPDTLKPTQAEFSTEKVKGWAQVRDGVDRSVLVSSDGHVLDGHHQWVAALATGEPVKAIVLDAPIRKLLEQVYQFPSVKTSEGATTAEDGRAVARADFKAAMADLADLLADAIGARAMMVPSDTPKLRETLVRLFVAAIDVVGTDLKAATKWVKAQLKANADTKVWWNKITDKEYQAAALEAVEQSARTKVDDLFAAAASAKSAEAMIDGRPYDMKRDNFKPPSTDTFIPKDVLSSARDQIKRLLKEAAPVEVSDADRAKAETLLKPILQRAQDSKASYDQKVIDIVKSTGAMGQMLATVKKLDSATRKLVNEVNFNVEQMYDTLRSTIVVSSYDDAQAVLDAIRDKFEVLPNRIKNMTDAEIDGKPGKFIPSGYGQVLVNVKLDGGVIAEIQINVPEMLAVKLSEGHALYEIERTEKEGSKAKADAIATQREIYPLAAAAAAARKDASVDGFEPKEVGKSDAGVKYSKPVDSSKPKTRPSGNLTNSVASPLVPNSQPAGKDSGTFIEPSRDGIVSNKSEKGLDSADPVERGLAVVENNRALMVAIADGSASIDDYRQGFERWVSEREAIETALMKSKKDELLARGGPYFTQRYKSETKAEVIAGLWREQAGQFTLGRSLQYGMGKGAYVQALREQVEGTSAEQLAQFSKERLAAAEDALARRAAREEGMQDPKTLDDYRNLLTVKVREQGMPFKAAYLELSPAQRATYDTLAAEESRGKRKDKKDDSQTVQAAGQAVGAQVIATKHTQKGHDLFVVQLGERVSRDDYNTLNTSAKRMGGYYSSFRGRGAVPGFQFTDRATAEAFAKLVGGDTGAAQQAAQDRRDAFADDRSQTGVQRLREMADKLDEQANAALGQERKVNTERRARFAANAEAKANAQKAQAATMRNIAQAVEDGKAQLLERVRQKTQVELLTEAVRAAWSEEQKANGLTWADLEAGKGGPETPDTASYAVWPEYTAYRSDLASLGRQLLEVDGTKRMGQQLLSVADDVTDAFNKFAKENTGKLMIYRTKDGGLPAFSGKEAAERAVTMSGYRGKAVPFMVKRGEYTIIASPSEAISRGLWGGDGDKRITLGPDFGRELVEKIGKAARRNAAAKVPWQLETVYDKRSALARMGIETPAEYRAALREFLQLRERAAAPDKVKQLERAMVGRRKDGFDFFPTPESVADDMVATADIQPGMAVLEPSAGMGHIAERMREAGAEPEVIEIAEDRRELLEAKGFNLVGRDFLADTEGKQYDRIVMNPPFSDGRDIEHVRHAFSLLKPGGRVVAIMGESAFTNQSKKATEFRAWLDELGGTEEKLPEGTFLDPNLPVNTGANARMVVIDKPEGDTSLSRGTDADGQGTMDHAALSKLVEKIQAGMPNMPKVHVLNGPAEAPEALKFYIQKQGAWDDVEGAMHNGEFYMFASGLSSPLRAEHVLAQHEAAHLGLRALLGSSLSSVMQSIWVQNATIRNEAAKLQKRGRLSNAEAVEEVIVDIPTERLAKLKGWRALVMKVRDYLAGRGYEALSERLTSYLAGTLNHQQRADLLVADLVRAARAHIAGKTRVQGNVLNTATMLSAGARSLADDAAKQEAWLSREAKARGFKDIDDLVDRDYPLFEKLAQLWRKKNPADTMLSRAKAITQTEAFKKWFGDSKVVDEKGEPLVMYHGTSSSEGGDAFTAFDTYASNYGLMGQGGYFTADPLVASSYTSKGKGTTPTVYPAYLSIKNPIDMDANVTRNYPDWVKAFPEVDFAHTDRLPSNGKSYTNEDFYRIVEDHLREDEFLPMYEGAEIMQEGLRSMGHDGITHIGGGRLKSDSVRHRVYVAFDPEQIKSATGNSGAFDPANPDIRLSRGQAKDAAERADDLIAQKSATVAPFDKVARTITRVTGVEKVLGAVYNRAGTLLDRYTPETVKAGIVSDYGVPAAVIDKRSMMQGSQRKQLRAAGSLLEKLSTLTRAESRVAYEWMNMDGSDPRAYMSTMQGLPEESVKTLTEVQKLVDQLSQEAVRLGQLSPEAYERNRMAYLRRSYVKHTAELTKSEVGKRSRAITILGDQYKGRGMTEKADMAQIQNLAPEWWKRKLQAGKADASLKGEKFLRLERRAPSGEGVKALDGMENKGPGKLLEIQYFPAGVKLPAKYQDWSHAGEWEVRTVQGSNLVMWRDFTKDEREKMGEIDEARYAIAKTLHGMIHDVEVGRYLEWLGQNYAKKEGEEIPGDVVEASERMRDTFKTSEWVKVPDSKIAGTSVLRYGKLAGQYLPGPIWNDLRQVVNGQFKPFGDTYAEILRLWKTSKTALSPAVHTNNIMSNFVMADWHDVTAGHMAKALRILMSASKGTKRMGMGGAVLRGASAIGMADSEAAREVLARYQDSGGDIGGWVTQEIRDEQLKPLLDALEKELAATGGQSAQAQIGVMAALQHAMMLRFPSAWEAFKPTKVGKAVATEAANVLDLYQSEDDVFRLAAWLKAKEEGRTDLEAGKVARNSFLDYRVNAPWIQAMRQSAWPFVSFSYRAVPMFIETAAKKPHKLMKLMLLAGAINALGVLLSGGDEDKERKLLPEEKAGRIWGLVPKLIRMPWNDAHGSPVYLDIRRFIPVGDVFDVGAGHSAVPMLPSLTPGGPLVLAGEVVLNKSAFTGKAITLETDTPAQQAAKVADYLYKAFAPNLLGLPGTYATTGVADAAAGRTDAFGREMSVGQAVASSFGMKLGSYPVDVLRRNMQGATQAQIMEIDKNITQLKRQRQTNRITQEEFQAAVKVEQEKKAKLMQELAKKM